MDRSLFLELIHRTKSTLDSIQSSAQLSRQKFIDKESGELFYQMIASNIEKIDLLLDGFLNYIKATTPILKRDTVKAIIEEVLRKHQIRLAEKKINISKQYEKNLPETIVPDEQLKFMLNSIFEYAMASLTSEGSIEISTRSVALPEESGEDRGFFKKEGRNIEIRLTFTRYKRPGEQFVKEFGLSPLQKELDLLLRLVHTLVQRNQGTMAFEADETKTKRLITLKFSTERRKAAFFHTIDK